MKRRNLFAPFWVALLATFCGAAEETTRARPNILWIVSEDNAPYLGCYGDRFANTPRIDRLATQGTLYKNAFANAPVCAPNRCGIILGMYPPSLGTQHMRSRNVVSPRFRLFPEYLRRAGYFCTNRDKTDYNLTQNPAIPWDQIRGGHYKHRKPGQPFFSVFNIETSHEGQLHGTKVREDFLRRDFTLPPYHPDTPEIRSNWVAYYEKLSQMDREVGEILDELEEAGLADETIVFYYSDHGGVLPRSKRFLYDTGVHVPLIVRFPPRFRHLAPTEAGAVSERVVSLVDLGPTTLSLAGIEIPEHMQGRAFLGPQTTPPADYAYLFRGRMDERYDMSRAVRGKRFKYIRNYLPHRIHAQHLDYLWKMPATVSWEEEYRNGRCNAAQRAFWEPKPYEELYDTETDPWEVRNLAASAEHREILKRMREANRRHILATRDAGFLPESDMVERAVGDEIHAMVRVAERYPLERILAVAEMAGEGNAEHLAALRKCLDDRDRTVRYWGATGCAILGKEAIEVAGDLTRLLDDPIVSVRIAAAEALCAMGRPDEALPCLVDALEHENRYAVLHAVNTLENIGEAARDALPALEKILRTRHGGSYVRRATVWTVERLSANR